MNSSMSVVMLPVMLIVLGLLVGGVVVLVALLANKQTRPFAVGLLGVGGMLFAILLAALVWVRVGRVESHNRAEARAMQRVDATLLAEQSAHQADHPRQTPLAQPDGRSAGHTKDWSFYEPSSGTPPSGRVNASWALLLMVLVVLAVLYGMLRMLNHREGNGRLLALCAALGVVVFAVILKLNTSSRPGTFIPPQTSELDQEWRDLVRPRIELNDPPQAGTTATHAEQREVDYTLIANGRELTFSSKTALPTAIAEIKKVWREDGRELRLTYPYGEARIDLTGSFLPSAVEKMIHRALVHVRTDHAGPAPTHPKVEYTVIANDQELTFQSDAPMSDAIAEVKELWLEAKKEINLKTEQGEITLTGKFLPSSVGSLLHKAMSYAREQAQPPIEPEQVGGDKAPPHGADGPKLVVDGKQTLLDPGKTNDEIADAVQAAQKELADDEKLRLELATATMDFGAGTPRDAILHAINAARESVSQANPPVEPELPNWIDQPTKRIGDVYRQVVEVGPYATAEECYEELGRRLEKITADYAREQSLSTHQSHQLHRLGFTPAMLMREVCVEEHLETFFSESVGRDMKRLYVQIEFDPEFRDRLQQGYATYTQRSKVSGLSILAGAVLCSLGGVFGLLKTDELTGGRYRKRLFLGVPAAIIGMFVLLLSLEDFGITF